MFVEGATNTCKLSMPKGDEDRFGEIKIKTGSDGENTKDRKEGRETAVEVG